MDSYHYWERILSRSDFIFGQFGEHFTVEGLPDFSCLGNLQYDLAGQVRRAPEHLVCPPGLC